MTVSIGSTSYMAILKMNSTSNIIWQSVYNYQPLIKGLTVDSTETYFYVAWAPAAVIISHTSTGVIYQSFYKIRNLNINIKFETHLFLQLEMKVF